MGGIPLEDSRAFRSSNRRFEVVGGKENRIKVERCSFQSVQKKGVQSAIQRSRAVVGIR